MDAERKGRCPECEDKLTQFGIDVEVGKVECLNCHARLSPLEALRDSDIILASRVLPENRRELFLTGLGFEKTAGRGTPKPVVFGLLLVLLLGALFLSAMLILAGHRISGLSPLVGGPLLCLAIYRSYRKEWQTRWVSKR